MHPSCSRRARPLALKVLCVQICMFYSSMCLAGWSLSSEAAKPRCGAELLSDLMFVCGDRGIHLGRPSRYGARPRGKGIVDQCCKSSGCDLQQLEMYCAKPKSKEQTTTSPTTTTVTAPHTTTKLDMFQAVIQKRLLEHMGAPNSPKREAYRKKAQPSPQWKSKASSSRRRMSTQSTTSRAPSVSTSPL
ncbi:insulin-like growth factor 3 [Melanotaenia boesemani]|uniref:insulin-like growth factor 3 n=1 Tax=Melanotaenia boesemani TaxID=1250792 RepID=UPI001C04476B|nr:insulin-like growth factor 3 [Melanotaenia boesemani]